jgi:hypothetical protein
MSRYSMIIQWSDEDRLFLVTIPEFADSSSASSRLTTGKIIRSYKTFPEDYNSYNTWAEVNLWSSTPEISSLHYSLSPS